MLAMCQGTWAPIENNTQKTVLLSRRELFIIYNFKQQIKGRGLCKAIFHVGVL